MEDEKQAAARELAALVREFTTAVATRFAEPSRIDGVLDVTITLGVHHAALPRLAAAFGVPIVREYHLVRDSVEIFESAELHIAGGWYGAPLNCAISLQTSRGRRWPSQKLQQAFREALKADGE